VHSASADLAPAGGAMIHVLKYCRPAAARRKRRARARSLLDLIQPGWREAVVEHRFLPSMMVTNDLLTAAHGGLRGGPTSPSHADGVYVAGDWVGPGHARRRQPGERPPPPRRSSHGAARQGGRMRESG
jgi:phytoene dehydrogenase-like protein